MLLDQTVAQIIGTPGEYYWGGAASTAFFDQPGRRPDHDLPDAAPTVVDVPDAARAAGGGVLGHRRLTADAITAHLTRVDPAFARVIAVAGPFAPRPPDEDPFNALARAIVFQQLAGNAARAIHGRFVALFDGRPTPEAVLRTPVDDLRRAGLSGNKATSMLDLAQKVQDGTVPLDRLDELSDDEIVSRLSTVRGIGRWTAEMFLLFQLRRPDVWPVRRLRGAQGFRADPRAARSAQTEGAGRARRGLSAVPLGRGVVLLAGGRYGAAGSLSGG